jgi:hypothetical protein
VIWSGTCTGPLPGPDGGYCAWEWLDGSAQWGPMPSRRRYPLPGLTADGGAIPIACPTFDEGGSFSTGNGGSNAGLSDGGATVSPAETPPAGTPAVAAGGNHAEGGGCAMSSGEGAGGAAYAALVALSLAIRIRGERRKRRARANGELDPRGPC